MDRFHFAFRALVLALLLPFPLAALDFRVTSYLDSEPDGCTAGDCTLREAVIAANNSDGADRILLSAGTYQLDRPGTGEEEAADGDLNITGNLEILGVGAGLTVIDGAGMGEVVMVASESNLVFTLRRLTVRNSDQGGLSIGVGVHTIEDCEISDNGIASGSGIQVSIAAQLTIRRSTIAGNANAGLSVTQGSVTLENVTIAGNGFHEIFVNISPHFSCTHCTISDAGDADAEVRSVASLLEFGNSIVEGDCSFASGGAVVSIGGNVESTGSTCQFIDATDQNGVTTTALALAALADNGGPTRTRLPATGSAAVGAAFVEPTIATDQRGVPRAIERESGAVERSAGPVSTPLFIDGFLQGTTAAWSATTP